MKAGDEECQPRRLSGWPCAMLACAVLGGTAVAAKEDPIDDLPVGHWYEIRGSGIASVVPVPPPPGIQGPQSVITQASGGAYDSKRDRLIVWGGGATSYAGNEVYAFDLNQRRWQRLTEPSKNVGGYERSGYYPDGLPRSRHSYDAIEYLPEIDRFCSFGALSMYPGGASLAGNLDCLDFDNLRWERRANAISYSFGAITGRDPKNGHIWMHGTGTHGYLTEYDPVKNVWYAHGRAGIEAGAISVLLTGEIDPVRRKFVAIGKGEMLEWDLDEPGMKRARRVRATGDAGVLHYTSPGLVFDPVLKKLVAWSGGGNLYVFEPESARWQVIRPAATNKVTPGPSAERGTFGRFRYVPSRNVYIVVSDIYENVFVYRLTPGKGERRN
jgi:hypothetical protein